MSGVLSADLRAVKCMTFANASAADDRQNGIHVCEVDTFCYFYIDRYGIDIASDMHRIQTINLGQTIVKLFECTRSDGFRCEHRDLSLCSCDISCSESDMVRLDSSQEDRSRHVGVCHSLS
jgi:hypothetical protein